MRMTRSIEYALTALYEIARDAQQRPILAKTIAQRHQMPLDYLLKVLQQLVHGGLLSSYRGPRGGFRLAREPEAISFLDVIEAVEGPFVDQGPENVLERRFLVGFGQAWHEGITLAAERLRQGTLAELLVGANLRIDPSRCEPVQAAAEPPAVRRDRLTIG